MEVSLNYLAGNSKALLEKNIVKRITDIQQLPDDDKAHLFALMDAFLRDHQAKKVTLLITIKPLNKWLYCYKSVVISPISILILNIVLTL